MKHKMRLCALVLVLLVTSCAHFAGKRVAAKEPPSRLIAEDGSSCTVSKSQWDKTEVGMKALCAWRGGRIPVPGNQLQAPAPR